LIVIITRLTLGDYPIIRRQLPLIIPKNRAHKGAYERHSS